MRIRTGALALMTLIGVLALGGCFIGLPTSPKDDTEEEDRGDDGDLDAPGSLLSAWVTFADVPPSV